MISSFRLCNTFFGSPIFCSTARSNTGTYCLQRVLQSDIDSLHAVRPPSRKSIHSSAISMNTEITECVSALHGNQVQAAIFVTGGGFQAVTWLMTVPGASRTVLDIRIPYANTSMADILGHVPETYASAAVSLQMAQAAYRHAANLAPFGASILGVSCTCALVTDRAKKGDHKVFVATNDGQRTRSYSLQLAKGLRDRAGEDEVASRLLLNAMCASTSVPAACVDLRLNERAGGGKPEIREQIQESLEEVNDPLLDVLEGRIRTVEYSGGNVMIDAPRQGRIYLPGSFNPVHDGHRDLLQAACAEAKRPADGCFELSVGNPDKGVLPTEEVQRRIRQFTDAGLPLVITQAPLYTIKAKLFPNSIFVVGYDTAIRLVDPKYYGGHTGMLLQFAELKHHGCSFLVAGRVGDDKRFMQLSDIDVPEELQEMELFKDIAEDLFRSDISSTELRKQQSKQA